MMGETNVSNPVASIELLMRRVPAGPTFFQISRPPESPMGPTWHAFKPTQEDTKGISMSRMRSGEHPEFLDLEAFAIRACRGKPPAKLYYVAILAAARLMNAPLSLKIDPDPIKDKADEDLGHVLLPGLNSNLDRSFRNSLTLTLAREHCLRVVGPFNCDGRLTVDFVDWSDSRIS